MQKQINQNKQDEVIVNNNNYSNYPGSWSQLFDRYKRIVHTKRKTDNFVEAISANVLATMFPAIIIGLFSLSPIGTNLFIFIFSVSIGLGVLRKLPYELDLFKSIHIYALYLILPLLLVFVSPLFYISFALIGIIYAIEKYI